MAIHCTSRPRRRWKNVINKEAMIATLHNEPKFSELFMAYLLTRNSRVEEDLIDQLFNSSEKRLARLPTSHALDPKVRSAGTREKTAGPANGWQWPSVQNYGSWRGISRHNAAIHCRDRPQRALMHLRADHAGRQGCGLFRTHDRHRGRLKFAHRALREPVSSAVRSVLCFGRLDGSSRRAWCRSVATGPIRLDGRRHKHRPT